MKPAAILHVDPERGFSGGETQVLALARHLCQAGHRCAIAAAPGGPLGERAAADGIEVIELACRRSHDPLAGFRLRRLVRERSFDLVHFHTARALSLAPFVSPATARVVTRRMDYPPRGNALYVRWLYGRVDAVIAISRAVRDALVRRGLAAEEIAIVPSGVEAERFHSRPEDARAARRALAVDGERSVVALVASLHARKGHEVLLRALARLAAQGMAPLCLMAGSGPEGDRLMEVARQLGVDRQVHWLGRLDDVRPVLFAADVVVLPSLAEGLGVAAVEAMAAGRPLVASAVGGIPELVRDRVEGLLVAPGDDAALAGALAECLADAALRGRLGAAGTERAAAFSTAAMARGTEAVYERVLERRRMKRRPGASPI